MFAYVMRDLTEIQWDKFDFFYYYYAKNFWFFLTIWQ